MKALTIGVALLTAAIIVTMGGCTISTPNGPASNLGSQTVTRYVAIGNSLTAGYQSNALYASAQDFSFPNLIARQLRLAGATIPNFEQPLYGDPGNADPTTGKAARYELISLVGPVIGPRGLTAGAPLNTGLTRQYDNLGIPGAVIFDFLDTTSFTIKAGPPRNNAFFSLVLRQSALGKTILAQARALRPDLVTFWLGNNDVLGYATSGGVSPSAPTSAAIFAALYAQAFDSLRASLPNAKIVVANIPNVTAIPFFNTLGPKVKPLIPPGVYLRYQKHGNTSLAFDSTRFTEANAPLLTLTGSAYATLLGANTGKWYRDKGILPPPAGIDTTKPFGFHPQNPWPDALTLDADEQVVAGAAVNAFNGTIATLAAAKGAALVDMNAFFTSVKANGYSSGGQKFTADYITGGLFSLDGVHPSSKGGGVVANQFIKVMNATWAMSIPMVDISSIPSIPVPFGKISGNGIPAIPASSFKDFDWLWGQSN
ncbi:MAG: hypothetical protein HY961_02590 [Ignavibacteriae bacterium]|nr:hypothetical protein [Ignavibacteriota bacterium]